MKFPRSVFVFGVLTICAGLGILVAAGEKSRTATPNAVPFGAPSDLTATLADPINIDLKWKDNASNEAGYFVEYSPDANNDYLIIEALPPNSTTYRHPNLLPHTRFVFRVRPFFGHASNAAEITTGKEGPQQDVSDNEPRQPMILKPPPKKSLKSAVDLNAAAPTDLTATLIPPAGVKLKWKDRAADADGYLLEIKDSDGPFRTSAFLEPGSTSLVTYNFPFESRFAFRVRAFAYGAPSNLAEQTTGEDPTMPSETAVKDVAVDSGNPAG